MKNFIQKIIHASIPVLRTLARFLIIVIKAIYNVIKATYNWFAGIRLYCIMPACSWTCDKGTHKAVFCLSFLFQLWFLLLIVKLFTKAK